MVILWRKPRPISRRTSGGSNATRKLSTVGFWRNGRSSNPCSLIEYANGAQLGIGVVNFRNHLVKITTCLAFTGVIVPSFRALAASEDVKKSTPTQLFIAAAANLKF